MLRPALVLALGLVVAPAFAGHAYDPGVNRLNVPADVLHILGAAAWIGALVGLVVFRDAERRRLVLLALGGALLLTVDRHRARLVGAAASLAPLGHVATDRRSS